VVPKFGSLVFQYYVENDSNNLVFKNIAYPTKEIRRIYSCLHTPKFYQPRAISSLVDLSLWTSQCILVSLD